MHRAPARVPIKGIADGGQMSLRAGPRGCGRRGQCTLLLSACKHARGLRQGAVSQEAAPIVQPEWPQLHMISTFWATPSQWALQYLALLGGMQLQAAFAHFLGAAAMVRLLRFANPFNGDHCDADCGKKLVPKDELLRKPRKHVKHQRQHHAEDNAGAKGKVD